MVATIAAAVPKTEPQQLHSGEKEGPVVVTGATGFIGSWLIMRLLEQGYTVRATVRDPANLKKTKPLLDLPNAKTHLSIWKADLSEEGSFDDVIHGSTGVFHVATPMDFESKDPENEVIKPAIEGMLGIMKACKKAGTVRRIVFTTSAGTLNVEEKQRPEYDESCWSDLDFITRVKMTGWMYFVSKTLTEKTAWEFARENNLDLITIIPPLVVGPFISSSMPPSLVTALSLITGNKAHYSILKQNQLVHLDDLVNAHIFLFNHPEASGRYLCSSHERTIFELAKMIRDAYPEYQIPEKFDGIDENIQRVHFSSKKLLALGFEFKYEIEDMLDGSIKSCRERGFLPMSTKQEGANATVDAKTK